MQILGENLQKKLLEKIRVVEDFPKPGIVFRDITTLINDADSFAFLLDHLYEFYKDKNLDFVVGIESRGFIFGAALASRLHIGFVPIRKPKKLPFTTISQKYSLEYGFDEVQIHTDAFRGKKDTNILLMDDIIVTGGTAMASAKLIKELGVKNLYACFVLKINGFGGDEELRKLAEVYNVLEA
ncbi:MAG: adenine phosphoribosyltransferase [Campylobacter sp.]|nr:adenine phosphoribosyltransferase [Campylobacter sp.]